MSRTLVEYPFETSLITDETVKFAAIFGAGHRLEPIITSMERYEKRIFEGFDTSSLQLRNLLRYERPVHLAATPDLVQSYPPGRDTYDALCGLIATFRLVEKWAIWDGLVEAPETGSVPKQLNEELIAKYIPPYWAKLEGLQTMLHTARTTVASLMATPSPVVHLPIPAHLKHLRDLAIGDAKSSTDAVVENFRVAAMHLSYILSLPLAQQAEQVLPDLPDLPKEWSHLTRLVGSNGPLTQSEQLSIINFTQSSEATTTKLRVVLHSALMISPIYLLVPSFLRKCRSFSRETLFKVAAALGNQKPQALRMFEDEIWTVLRNVVLDNLDLKKALFQLVQSPTWTAMEELPPSDPSVTFFCRLKTTLVPMPSRQILPAPAASYTFSGPPINMPSQPMLPSATSGEPGFLRHALPMPLRQILPTPIASYTFSGPPIDMCSRPMLSAAALGEPAFLRPALPMPSRQISPAPAASHTFSSPPIDMPSQSMSSTTASGESAILSHLLPTWPLPLPAPVPSPPTLSVSCPPTMPDFPISVSLPGTSTETLSPPTLDTANDKDLASTPGSATGTLSSPILSPANDEDPSFKDLDDNDSDLSAPSPPDYHGGNDTEGDHVMPGSKASQTVATRTSSRIEKNRLKKLESATAKLASLEPAGWKKGKGGEKDKKFRSKNTVESDEEDGEAVKTGDKRARPYKCDGVARGKAGKRPRLDEGEVDSADDGISEDEDGDGGSADESENDLVFWKAIQRDLFVDANPITLDIDVVPEKYTSAKKIQAYGPTDTAPVVFTPVVQDSDTLTTIESIAAAVQASYVNGLPLHLANPDCSVIKIIPEPEFVRTSDSEVQDILREKHIVVSGILHQETTFKEALRDTAPLNSRVDIQDQSEPVGTEADDRVFRGTLGMMVECSEKTDGKILNALDIPLPFESRERTQFASDIYALIATLNGMGWKPGMSLHNEDFRWAIASLKGAFHGFHLDSDGLGTFIQAMFGSKWWILASPKPGSNADFAKINTFLAGNFNLDEAPDGWQLEAIVLAPGSKLIMRPNTPHAVLTIEDSVFKGGHYNATSTVKDTFYGLIHGLVAGRYISNTDHGPSRFVLRQMVAFYHAALVLGKVERDEKAWAHVPDVLTVDGLIGLITLCSFGVLCNVLDFDTYRFPGQRRDEKLSAKKREKLVTHDYNAMTPRDRMHCMRTRALALDLIFWLQWKYEGLDWSRLFAWTLAQLCSSLYAYKAKAEAQGIEGAPHCTLKSLKTQMAGIFYPESNFQIYINMAIEDDLDEIDRETLSIDHIWDNTTLSEKDQVGEYTSIVKLDMAGISERDKLYMKYTNDSLQVKQEFTDNVHHYLGPGSEDEGQEEGSDDTMDLSGQDD